MTVIAKHVIIFTVKIIIALINRIVKAKGKNKSYMITDRSSSSRVKPLRAHIMDMMGLLIKNKKLRIDIPNRAYNDTLDRDIMSAIKRIEKEENALIELQYPLHESSMLHGYMGLKSYLLNLYYESAYCAEYDKEELCRLVENYCKTRGLDCIESCFNIYTAVYLNGLFCDYLKKDYGTLRITEKDEKLILGLLGMLTDEEREEILFSCAKRFTYGSLAYNNKMFIKLLPSIICAIKRKNLGTILTIEK